MRFRGPLLAGLLGVLSFSGSARGGEGDSSAYVESASVVSVLRGLARVAGFSLVVPADLRGNVSVWETNRPWRDVYSAILSPLGYQFREIGSLVVVERCPVSTVVLASGFRWSEERLKALQAVVPKDTVIEVCESGLLVRGSADAVAQVRSLVSAISAPGRQVRVKVRFVEMTSQLQDNLGVQWASLAGYTVGYSSTLGVAGSVSGSNPGAFLGSLGQSGFNAILSALFTSDFAHSLAEPDVAVEDGEEARVSVGQEYPLPQYQFSQQNAVLQVSGFSYKDIGIILKVTPRIEGDRVVLVLDPEVSSVAGTVSFGGAGGSTIPTVNSRVVHTVLICRRGETVALGGLVYRTDDDEKTGVPVLKSLPFVGGLFRSRARSSSDQRLVIFVTVEDVMK